ncbi:MAG: helix-turn-helix transcriptional regulator [Deltaproteobacteria bacterium]|nr:helix-turn-helix transcriptional regulator [Deltaproteobacteria bacterium]
MGSSLSTKVVEKVWRLRKSLGLNQGQMAKKLGIGQSTYSSIEKGTSDLRLLYIPKLAEVLGVEIWQLFTDLDQGQTGPLSPEEIELIFSYRNIAHSKDKKSLLQVAKSMGEG